MATLTQSTKSRRASIWLPILGYGFLLFAIYGAAAFLVEMYSGGCMFVIPIYFYALVIVLGKLRLQRFGTGLAMLLPIAILGVPMDYYGDWVMKQNLIGPWYALGWAPVFLAIGLAVDLVHRYAPADWHPRWRAVATGVGFGLAFYLVVLFALTAFYPETDQVWHLDYFQGGIYFTLPWMLVNGGFAGYTAYAISRQE